MAPSLSNLVSGLYTNAKTCLHGVVVKALRQLWWRIRHEGSLENDLSRDDVQVQRAGKEDCSHNEAVEEGDLNDPGIYFLNQAANYPIDTDDISW